MIYLKDNRYYQYSHPQERGIPICASGYFHAKRYLDPYRFENHINNLAYQSKTTSIVAAAIGYAGAIAIAATSAVFLGTGAGLCRHVYISGNPLPLLGAPLSFYLSYATANIALELHAMAHDAKNKVLYDMPPHPQYLGEFS